MAYASCNSIFGNTGSDLDRRYVIALESIPLQFFQYLSILDQGVNKGSSPLFSNLTIRDNLTFTNDAMQSVSLTVPASLTPYTLALPSSAGNAGQLMAYDGAGSIVWYTLPSQLTNFDDSVFYLYNHSDTTKKLLFDISAVTTGTSRTVKMADADVDLKYAPTQYVNTTATPQFAKLGIGKVAGTEVLEAAGNIKCTGNLMGAGANLTGLASTGTGPLLRINVSTGYLYKDNAFDQAVATTSTPCFSKLGIAQVAGTEVLEVTGNIKATGSLKLMNSTYALSIAPTTLTAAHTLTLPNTDLTLTAYSGPDQSVSSTGSPQFTKVGIAQAAGTDVLEVTGNVSATSELRLKNNWRIGLQTSCMNVSNWAGDNFPLQLYLNGTTSTEWRCTNSSLTIQKTNSGALTSLTLKHRCIVGARIT